MPNSLDINQLPFDKDMQAALIGHVFTNVSFGQNAVFHIDYKWFNNPNHQQLFKIIKDFWEENKAIPTVQEVSSSPKINAMEIREMNAVRGELTNCREVAKVIRLEVITKDLDSWITARKYIIGIQHFTDKYNSGRLKEAIGDINSTIDDAKRVSFNGVQGVSFLNPVEYLEKKKLSYQNALSTGLRNLDDALAQDGDSRGGGSLYVGDMTVLLAPTNAGKTVFMSTIAVHNAVHGKDVLFMAHEGNKDDLRINLLRCAMGGETMANLMEISQTDQGARKLNLVSQALEKHLKYIFFVKPGMTVEEVMRIIAMAQEERIAKTGKGFDLLVSDYPAKLLTEIGKRGNLPVRSMYDIIYNQYTQAAGYYNFHVLTAMQTNREGSKANKNEDRLIQSEDVAEAWGIITTATNVITIKRSKKDEKANLITYYVAKSRSNRTGKAILCRSRFEGFKAHDERYENFAYWGDASMTDDERIEQLLKTFKGQTITDMSSASGLIATPD